MHCLHPFEAHEEEEEVDHRGDDQDALIRRPPLPYTNAAILSTVGLRGNNLVSDSATGNTRGSVRASASGGGQTSRAILSGASSLGGAAGGGRTGGSSTHSPSHSHAPVSSSSSSSSSTTEGKCYTPLHRGEDDVARPWAEGATVPLEECAEWFYLDAKGHIRGPFPTKRMRMWYQASARVPPS